jgi:hypothetical protein
VRAGRLQIVLSVGSLLAEAIDSALLRRSSSLLKAAGISTVGKGFTKPKERGAIGGIKRVKGLSSTASVVDVSRVDSDELSMLATSTSTVFTILLDMVVRPN